MSKVSMQLKQLVDDFPKAVFAFGIVLFLFFAISLGAVDQCDKKCLNTDHTVNGFGYFTTTVGMLISLITAVYSGYIMKKLGYFRR